MQHLKYNLVELRSFFGLSQFFAFLWALGPLHIISDNKYVVDSLNLLFLNSDLAVYTWPHADLWSRIQTAIQTFAAGSTVSKVKSHTDNIEELPDDYARRIGLAPARNWSYKRVDSDLNLGYIRA